MHKIKVVENFIKKCNPFMKKIVKVEVFLGEFSQLFMLIVLIWYAYHAAAAEDFKSNLVENTCIFVWLYILISIMHGLTKYLEDLNGRLEKEID